MSLLNSELFQCLQGECPLSCCCDWRIGLDEATERRWQATDEQLSQTWFAALECVGEGEFQVCLLGQGDNGCCQLMDEQGLCRPHREAGIDYKPQTCARFPLIQLPEQSQSTNSLSLACPEAGRMLFAPGEQDLVIPAEMSIPGFTTLRDFANSLFVDWHTPQQDAGEHLCRWVADHLPAALAQILALQGMGQGGDNISALPDLLSSLGASDRKHLRRYLSQVSLHLGLPDHAYAGDGVASLSQLLVLLLGLLLTLAHARQRGIELDAATLGLCVAHLERQWGHPSSGLELVQREPWLAQLDWREPVLGILADQLDG